MKKSVKFILFLMLSVLFFNCEFSSDINSDTPSNFEYPLEIGNTWEYERVFELYNFRPDSLRDMFPFDKIYSQSIVEVKKDTTLQDSLQCVIVQENLTEDNHEFISWGYYANRAAGFYQYAYKNGGGGFTRPKQRIGIEYNIAGMSFNSIREASDYFTKYLPSYTSLNDTIIYWEPKRKVLTYPPEIGEEWLMFQGPPFTIHKKIAGRELVSTKAGNYNCYKIQWIYTGILNENITFYDYISNKGLIKRSILFQDMAVSYDGAPDSEGYIDSSEETILTDINF